MKYLATVAIALGLFSLTAIAQIPGLGGGRPGLGDLGVESVFKKGPAITTNLKDAKWEDATQDSFNPDMTPLSDLARGPSGGFILKEGGFGSVVQSYCLHAGTHGPGQGDAYLFAPPKGPYEKAVIAVAENSVAKPQIPQRTIQQLLWAMLARTKFSDLNRELQLAASQLLTPKQIADLNGGALAFLTDEAFSRGLLKEPPLVRQVMEAENRLRQLLTSPTSTFEEMERVAVLLGDVAPGPGSRNAPRGRWSKHPNGFLVRYLPSGYSRTRLEVFVPAGSKAIGTEFNPATHIAVPVNTARQRLLQSGRIVEGE